MTMPERLYILDAGHGNYAARTEQDTKDFPNLTRGSICYIRGDLYEALQRENTFNLDAANKGEHARLRATGMEGLIEDLRSQLTKSNEIREGLQIIEDGAYKTIKTLRAENTKLREALENAKRLMEEAWSDNGEGGPVFIPGDIAFIDKALSQSDRKAVAKCSGCGHLTDDRRAITGCKGYCQDSSGKSCNAFPCPTCGRVHYWTGSSEIMLPAGGGDKAGNCPEFPEGSPSEWEYFEWAPDNILKAGDQGRPKTEHAPNWEDGWIPREGWTGTSGSELWIYRRPVASAPTSYKDEGLELAAESDDEWEEFVPSKNMPLQVGDESSYREFPSWPWKDWRPVEPHSYGYTQGSPIWSPDRLHRYRRRVQKGNGE